MKFLSRFNFLDTYLFSASLWVGGSLIYLSFIPSNWWQYRDDSVIHLSQARSFSLFGSIGLSAGDRVEAMSSPLNFAISWIVYLFQPELSYESYLKGYQVITLLILSLAINYLFKVSLERKLEIRALPIAIVNTFIFIITMGSWTIFGWLISGMENVLCVILFLLLIANLIKRDFNLVTSIILFSLLGLCRIEMSALIAPILLLASLRVKASKRARVHLFLIPVVVWIVIHLARFSYFGHLLPNTATALNKNLSVLTIVYLATQYLIIASKVVFESSTSNPIYFKRLNRIGFIIFSGLGIWRVSSNTYPMMYEIALLLCFLGIQVLIGTLMIFTLKNWHVQLLILIAIIPLNHYFLFGPARLSAFRIVGMFVVPIFALILVLILRRAPNFLNFKIIFFLVFSFSLVYLFIVPSVDKPRNLCCLITPSENLISEAADNVFSVFQGPSPLPIVANPDLGKISFSKDLVNVDLGLIGEPLLAKISIQSPHLVDEYLIDFVAPDVFELHGYWSCRYATTLASEKFKNEWVLTWSGFVSEEMNPPNGIECHGQRAYSIWKRNIPIEERILSEAIAAENFEEYSNRIRAELELCRSTFQGCEYVARGIIRNKANLIRTGLLDETVKLLENEHSYEFDSLRILQPRGWADKAMALVEKIVLSDSK